MKGSGKEGGRRRKGRDVGNDGKSCAHISQIAGSAPEMGLHPSCKYANK